MQTDFRQITQAELCPLYQESFGFPLFVLQHLGPAAFTQMLQIPLTAKELESQQGIRTVAAAEPNFSVSLKELQNSISPGRRLF